MSELVIYRSDAGTVEVRLEGELDRASNVQNLHIAGSDQPISVEEPDAWALIDKTVTVGRPRPASVGADSAPTANIGDSNQVGREFLRSINAIRCGINALAVHTESGR